MLNRTAVHAAIVSAFGLSLAGGAHAQETQRIEITGSAIKRIAQEGALPVMTLSREDIAKSGATTVTDLIQALPSMQNFVPASSSVNGGGAGVTTAALHSLPSKYTLVLLDGHRVAPLQLSTVQGGGYGVNLESLPLDAIERVEILTDGASALYGSDAIAGVVNFILKKNKTDGDVSFVYNRPQHAGGGSWNAALSKGFGNLDTDNFNVLFSISHDKQDSLAASQRKFSANGAYFPFSSGGTNYIFDQRTGNTEPANISFSAVPRGAPAGTDGTAYSLNPYYTRNGNCGSPLGGAITDPVALGAIGVSCRFNYAATVQDIPSSVRDSGLLKGTIKVNEDTMLWGELSLSRYKMTAQYAPSAQPLVTSPTQLPALFNNYVAPYLNANNLTLNYIDSGGNASNGTATIGYRSVSLGGRTDDYQTDARHIAFGIDGAALGWDYNANLTLSNSQITDTAAGGFSDYDLLSAAVASGAYDPVLGTGSSSLSSAILNSQFSKSVSDMNTLHIGAQHDVFKLPGGTSIVSLGADYTYTHYKTGYSSLRAYP